MMPSPPPITRLLQQWHDGDPSAPDRLVRVPFDEDMDVARGGTADPEVFLATLDEALTALAADHPRVADVIRLRVFAGRSLEDVARHLGLSTGTIKRDFAFGRAWLARRLQGAADETRW